MKSGYTGKPNEQLRQQRILRGWSLIRVANELRILCEQDHQTVAVNSSMIWKWEQGKHTPSSLYQDAFCRLYKLTADKLGFVESSALFPLTEMLDQQIDITSALPAMREHDTIEDIASEQLLLSASATPVAWESESKDMDKSRRRLLQYTPHLIGGTIVSSSSYDLLNASLLERLSRALAKPSSIDEATLLYLEHRTDSYWGDRHSAVLASSDLLSYVIEHLQKLVTFLDGSLVPSVRQRLCGIVSQTAQLIGEIFFDMGNPISEKVFKSAAITAAQEANNPFLEAVAWGRMSFVWTYTGNTQKALTCIQKARYLANRCTNPTICTWLAAVEAEIQAILRDRDSCLKALTDAECVENSQNPDEDSYWLHFDRFLLGGYQGVCFRHLSHIEGTQGTLFLGNAEEALKSALALLTPAMKQHQPTLIIDLADTYIGLGKIEEGCECAIQAATMTLQIKSQITAQRLLLVRRGLEPWKDTQFVKNLDERIAPLLIPNWYTRN